MVSASSPGKLMIAGEWAVLEPGHPCIVTAVDIRVKADLENSDIFLVSLDDFGITAEFDFNGNEAVLKNHPDEDNWEKLRFPIAAVDVAVNYLKEIGKPPGRFSLKISKDSHGINEAKTSFGYYASSIVSTVAGILALNGVDISKNKDIIFKLSSIAYYKTPGRGGSAYNIAASVYGKTFIYRRFDGEWLKSEMELSDSGKQTIRSLLAKPWPGLYAKAIEIPKPVIISIGIVGEPVSSHGMVRQMSSFKSHNMLEYDRLMGQIKSSVEHLIVAFENNDIDGIMEMLKKNQLFLKELGERSGIDVETPKLRRLSWIASRHGCVGKLSGAGKTDMGIAVCIDKTDSDKVKKEWEDNGIIPVDVKMGAEGVKVGN